MSSLAQVKWAWVDLAEIWHKEYPSTVSENSFVNETLSLTHLHFSPNKGKKKERKKGNHYYTQEVINLHELLLEADFNVKVPFLFCLSHVTVF